MAKLMYPFAIPGFSGLDTRRDPSFLTPDQAQAATNCDLYDGVLSGTPGLGGTIASGGTARTKWISLVGGGTWAYADETRYALNDGAFTYATRFGRFPALYDGAGNAYSLGVQPMQGASWTLAATGGINQTVAYGFSYQTFDGLESNIQPFDLTFAFPIGANNKITFNNIWPADQRVSGVRVWAAVVTGGVTGVYYLQTTIWDRTSTGVAFTANPTTTGTQLTWLAGGYPSNTLYVEDHSAAPALTRLADRIHSMASGTAAAGSGIAIGAIDNTLYWSANGYAQYWPILNSMSLDSTIEAIVAYTGFTAIFATAGTYAFSGNSGDQMSLQRLDAAFSIAPDAGPSAVRTPLGTFFVAPEGLAVFDGSSTAILSAGKIAQSYFTGLTIRGAAYFKQKYYLFHAAGYLVVDLRDGLANAHFTTSATVLPASTLVDFTTPVVAGAQRPFAIADPAVTPTPIRKMGFVASSSNNTLYVLGGTDIMDTTGTGELASYNAFAFKPTISGGRGIWVDVGTMSGSERRCRWQPVEVGGLLYAQGGNNGIVSGVSTTYSTMQIFNTSSGVWSTPLAGGPTASSYGAAADITGGDTTGFWLHGGTQAGGSPAATFQKFTISTSTWGNVTISGGSSPALCGHGMVYVAAANFSDAQARLFIFGGATSSSNGGLSPSHSTGTNTVHCFNLSTGIFTNDATSDGGVSSATAAGVAVRCEMVWAFDSASAKIYLHGGSNTSSEPLSDLWEFDPVIWVNAGSGARVSAWVNHAGTVVNFEERTTHGGAFFAGGQHLYLLGGASSTDAFNSDLVDIEVNAIQQAAGTPGIYVIDGTTGNIKLLEGGAAQTWTWRTGDFRGQAPTTYKHAQRIKIDYQGQIVVASYSDGGSVQTLLTLQSTSRTQQTLWLPFGSSTYSASKTEPGNTTTSISSFAGPATAGTVVLSVTKTTPSGNRNVLQYGTGASQTFDTGFNDIPWPVTLVGGPGEGTITINNSGGPPGGGADEVYTDNVTVSTTAGVAARGKRLSFQFTGSTYSGTAAKLWPPEIEIVEEQAA